MQDMRKMTETYRMSHWAEVMNRRKESGESIRKFCQAEGIHQNVYFYWQRKLREAACAPVMANQASVSVNNIPLPAFMEVRLAECSETLSLPEPSSLPETSKTSSICVEINGYKITADSTYPPDKLISLCREFARPC